MKNDHAKRSYATEAVKNGEVRLTLADIRHLTRLSISHDLLITIETVTYARCRSSIFTDALLIT